MTRRFQRRTAPGWIAVLILLAVVAVRLFGERDAAPVPETLSEDVVQVQRVVDGDTLLLENGARVRLLGLDAPESVKPDSPVQPWGPEASAFTRDFVRGGTVRLQFDRERQDRFGRFLAYVWVEDRLLNEEIIRAGLAEARFHYHYSESMKRRFRRAQEEAQAARRGMWGKAEGGKRRNRNSAVVPPLSAFAPLAWTDRVRYDEEELRSSFLAGAAGWCGVE